MWFALLGAALAASSVAELEKTVLSDRADLDVRNRAVVELGQLAETDEDARWAVLELRHQLDPEDEVARIATAAAIQVATIEDLTGAGWPAWSRGHVSARVQALLGDRCDEPEVWALPMQAARLAEVCAPVFDLDHLALQMATAEDDELQRRAADLLVEAAVTRPGEVNDAVLHVVSWRAGIEFPMGGTEALLSRFDWTVDQRRALAVELVTWRVAVTLVGLPEVPERLDSELRELLWAETDTYGEPSDTRAWLHVLGSTGADPLPVVARLGVDHDARWQVVIDQDRALKGAVTEAVPLIADRSPVVRARAAARLEANPVLTASTLRRMYRYAPGRSAPLRGDVAAPALEYTEVSAEKWATTLVDWAKRSMAQRDDAALRATMSLLAEPSLSAALTDIDRDEIGQKLLKLADGDGTRSGDLVQAMDALIRGVSFYDGGIPIEDGEVMQTAAADWYEVPGVEREPDPLPLSQPADLAIMDD